VNASVNDPVTGERPPPDLALPTVGQKCRDGLNFGYKKARRARERRAEKRGGGGRERRDQLTNPRG
jgi:hypothetical protein